MSFLVQWLRVRCHELIIIIYLVVDDAGTGTKKNPGNPPAVKPGKTNQSFCSFN